MTFLCVYHKPLLLHSCYLKVLERLGRAHSFNNNTYGATPARTPLSCYSSSTRWLPVRAKTAERSTRMRMLHKSAHQSPARLLNDDIYRSAMAKVEDPDSSAAPVASSSLHLCIRFEVRTTSSRGSQQQGKLYVPSLFDLLNLAPNQTHYCTLSVDERRKIKGFAFCFSRTAMYMCIMCPREEEIKRTTFIVEAA